MLRRNLTIASFIIASVLMTMGSAAAATDRSTASDDYVVLDDVPKGLDLLDRYLPQRLLVILILGLLLHHLLPLMGNNHFGPPRVAPHDAVDNTGVVDPDVLPENPHAHRIVHVPAGRQRAIVMRATSHRVRSRSKRRRSLPERGQLPAARRARRPGRRT